MNINIIDQEKDYKKNIIVLTNSKYFHVALILLIKLIRIKIRFSQIQIGKSNLENRAKLIIKRVFDTHTDLKSFESLVLVQMMILSFCIH